VELTSQIGGSVTDALAYLGALASLGGRAAYYTFVALDADNKPKPVPQLITETDEEKKLFDGALRRRQLRLILGGKMKPDDALELKALFVKD
jgi:hypothetical protein